MRTSVAASLIFALGLLVPVSASFSARPEELEGSGYELDSFGSGSGDWSDQEETENIKDPPNSKGTRNTSHGPPVLHFDDAYKAIIAGGVVGVAFAAILAALLIYMWQKKDNGGYIQGQQRTSAGIYHSPNMEVVRV
ncbi:Syndecan-2-B [Liparis tanakae]|uniref:Syndecan-2-B n=1 Tax=Liparis tanakae TaxID=230148 RepID=A0A4Z2FWB1_9TELE|nr:Syndecan-2-B [Liparis tanakae]